ncbi:hypothetical protein Dimus_035175 [Dionaea muscipula]
MLSLKLLLTSTAVVLSSVLLSLLLPQLLASAASVFPDLWSSLHSWFRPPYLYVIINGIIITIAASCLLHNHNNHFVDEDILHHHNESEINIFPAKAPSPYEPLHMPADDGPYRFDAYGPESMKDVDIVNETTAFRGLVLREAGSEEEEVMKAAADDRVAELKIVDREQDLRQRLRLESTETLSEISPSAAEKPSVITRFARNRRPSRASPEAGKALRVAKPKREETLETIWKKITEGRRMPLTRHMKKSDTWQNNSLQQANSSDNASPQLADKLSETFKDRSTGGYSASLRKEPSLSQDELNRRVEAFINKFNKESRLQRQQSLKQNMEMISRGVA